MDNMLTDVRVYRVKIALFEFFCELQIYKSDLLATKSFHLATETQMCCYIKPLCTYLEKSSLEPDSLVKLMVTGQTPKLFPVQNYIT